jgi:2,3-bisphosphoglycerate-dependent phosphoglycerate mutase
MQLYFIRHGQSANNELWDRTRSSNGRRHDPELTETGIRQAQILGEFLYRHGRRERTQGRDPLNLSGFGITHVYTSLMLRAVATANEVAEALDLPLLVWEDVHEVGGLYLDDESTGEKIGQPGCSRSYYAETYPRMVLPKTLSEQGWWNRPFEVAVERPLRAQRFLADLIRRHGCTQDHVAVISHGDFFNLFLGAVLGIPIPEQFWFSMNNVAITRFDFDASSVTIVYTNRVDHLPRDLVT